MKKLLTIILVATSFFATAQVKISELTAATDTPALSSLTAIVESGTTKKATIQKLKNAILKNVTASTINGWGLTGNSGTDPATNFLGPADSLPLLIKAQPRINLYTDEDFIVTDYSDVIDYFQLSYSGRFLKLSRIDSFYCQQDTSLIVGLTNKRLKQINSLRANITGQLSIVDGTQGTGKVFTSDASGNGSWQNNAAPTITSGIIAPASTPGKIGDLYVDTSAGKLYFAKGTASSADWIITN